MVLKFLRSLVSKGQPSHPVAPIQSSDTLEAGGAHLAVEPHIRIDEVGFPRMDWQAISAWVESLDPPLQSGVWGQAEIAWLSRVRDSLDGKYQLDTQGSALLLSSLDKNVARSTLDFMTKTPRRISAVLDGIAVSPEWGHDILIVFDDDETYYRYVSHFYKQEANSPAAAGCTSTTAAVTS